MKLVQLAIVTLPVIAFAYACGGEGSPSGSSAIPTNPLEGRETTFPTAAAAATTDKIAFSSDRDGGSSIYVMNADGSDQVRFSTIAGSDTLPEWSPDGTRMVYTHDFDGNHEVYVRNSDGRAALNLSKNKAYDGEATWSPDGARIAFAASRFEDSEIYAISPDGSDLTLLSANSADDLSPDWSPDGTRILFTSMRDGNQDIYVMNSDGSDQTRLTYSLANDGYGDWSPDGTMIAFQSDQDGNEEIYVLSVDGLILTNITNHPGNDSAPAWSPDGTQIAFTSDRDGNSEIYVMSSDGSTPRNLTRNPAEDIAPSWSPTEASMQRFVDQGLPRPVPIPTAAPPSLQLVSLDCAIDQYLQGGGSIVIVGAGGRIRNVSDQASDLVVQLLLFNQQDQAIIPFLGDGPYVGGSPEGTVSREALLASAVPVEPQSLGPGQEGTFRFPDLGDPFGRSQSGGRTQRCSVRFVECAPDCREVPFANVP